MKRYVIIGGGAAGVTAAEKIKSIDKDSPITIFSEESEPFYYRVRLPEVISGEVELNRLIIHPLNWYEKNNIALKLGEPVTSIDLASREVSTAKGREPYDALLLAAGARSFIPPVPGSAKPGVYALRTYTDAKALSEQAPKIKTAVLVGGGLLGLEAAYGLTKKGVRVRVVEFFDRLLPRQMDKAGAAKLQKMLEAMGFEFYLGVKTKEIIGQNKAEGLALEDGRVVSGELVLFSAGVRPNLDLAKAAGLEVDKGVKVDDRLMTSREGVYAAGDLTEHRGRLYGIWPAAKEQGLAAGTNMAGGQAVYQGTVMSNSLKVVGVDLTSAGNIDAEGKLQSMVFEEDKIYRKIVVDQGRLAGMIFLGLTHGVKECLKALEKGLDISSHLTSLDKKDFDFSLLK